MVKGHFERSFVMHVCAASLVVLLFQASSAKGTLPTPEGVAAEGQQVGQKAKQTGKKARKKAAPFRWVNRPKTLPQGVSHAVFRSPSMGLDVGYCIYLPPEYREPTASEKRFPVVYYLHGGRPGSELKSVKLATEIHRQIASSAVPDMIYVFVNGGPVSHYNMVDRTHAMGADVFIKELIPHIDRTYRTIADRSGRGIEGFSQGGRGTTRLAFRYPELFCSAAPGGAGQATEKRISEEGGRESESLVFSEGDNTYDLARQYAKSMTPALALQIHVGTAGFNFENNLAYMEFLTELEIPFTKVVVDGVPHSAAKIYEKAAIRIMKHHATAFNLER